jgi:hypothetical protein
MLKFLSTFHPYQLSLRAQNSEAVMVCIEKETMQTFWTNSYIIWMLSELPVKLILSIYEVKRCCYIRSFHQSFVHTKFYLSQHSP